MAVGKTAVSSSMIDCVTAKLGRKLYEVPVGFKWFVDGLARRLAGFRRERRVPVLRFCAATAPSGRPTRTASFVALLAAEITRAHRHGSGTATTAT